MIILGGYKPQYMKKILLPISFFCISTAVFSQENKNDLTEAQKEELRKNHNSTIQFSSSNNKASGNTLNFTSSKEESNQKITKVIYYNGTQDSTYKEFKYIKPE